MALLRRRPGAGCGKPAPDVTLPDLNGVSQTLSSVVVGKKFALLVFYSPSCPHCIEFLKELDTVCYRVHQKDFVVYTVSSDTKENIHEFNERNNYSWINTIYEHTKSKEHNPYKDYVVLTTPTVIMIDNQMQIISRFTNLNMIKKQLE